MTLFKFVLSLLVSAGLAMATAWLGGESALEGVLQMAAATGFIAGLAKTQQLFTDWRARYRAESAFAGG